jgi:hypothetical protein
MKEILMTTSRIILALAATLVAAPAVADDGPRVAPSAPISIEELRASGAGTVSGTVSEIGARGFMLSDAGSIWVRSKDGSSYMRDGDRATVTGRFDRGTLRAQQVIAADGTLLGRRDHRHDDDRDDDDRRRRHD